jgi:hypothetical protein
MLSGVRDYIYEALVHANCEDQKAYEEEVAAQHRALEEH